MKILIYGINYSPELTGIGKYTGEMASWLGAVGHDIRVVTAVLLKDIRMLTHDPMKAMSRLSDAHFLSPLNPQR